ncbi:MAG: HIRAN domain-containing protein [Myxococcales bacterium]
MAAAQIFEHRPGMRRLLRVLYGAGLIFLGTRMMKWGDGGALAFFGVCVFLWGIAAFAAAVFRLLKPAPPTTMSGADLVKLPPYDVSGEFRGLDVVGESNYQDELEELAGGRTESSADVACTALLVPEANNRFDPNAIAVVVDEEVVGYLPRHMAAEVRPRIIEIIRGGHLPTHPAKIVGGWDRDGDLGNFGVKLVRPRARRSTKARAR